LKIVFRNVSYEKLPVENTRVNNVLKKCCEFRNFLNCDQMDLWDWKVGVVLSDHVDQVDMVDLVDLIDMVDMEDLVDMEDWVDLGDQKVENYKMSGICTYTF
jgi:hypothetical protein